MTTNVNAERRKEIDAMIERINQVLDEHVVPIVDEKGFWLGPMVRAALDRRQDEHP